jgi:hypothetical protein
MNIPNTIARKPASWRGVTPIQPIVPSGMLAAGPWNVSDVAMTEVSLAGTAR